jgi:hypothetical protein
MDDGADTNDKPAAERKPRIDPRLVSPDGVRLKPMVYNGLQIFVEKFGNSSDQPLVWYRHDRFGNRHRFQRKSFGTTSTIVEYAAPP